MAEDTIAAITTVLGPSSVGAIRISGPNSALIADRVFYYKGKTSLKDRPTHTITYGKIIDQKGQMVDEALALTMWAPRSFTGEDVVELQCHGGMVVLRKALEMVLEAGARLAEPGEFSKRAFLNGKLDLSQAEAIMDIINAKTETGVRAAANNLQGSIAVSVKEMRRKVVEIIAYLEADIDFPEEDFDRIADAQLERGIADIEGMIDQMLQTYESGRIIREGLKTALVGKPNVGKSSLLNALLKEKRAIVTDIPGTTRDLIEEYYNLGGIPLVLMDTAGIRETEDLIEKLGVEKTQEAIEKADLIIYVMDISEGVTADDLEFIRRFPQEKMLLVMNKVDLMKADKSEKEIRSRLTGFRVVLISAKEGTGLKELKEGISSIFFGQGLEITDKPFLSNARQKEALTKARKAVRSARRGVEQGMPSDFISIDLKQAWLSLGEVTGETLGEDIIEQIFTRFCLGK